MIKKTPWETNLTSPSKYESQYYKKNLKLAYSVPNLFYIIPSIVHVLQENDSGCCTYSEPVQILLRSEIVQKEP